MLIDAPNPVGPAIGMLIDAPNPVGPLAGAGAERISAAKRLVGPETGGTIGPKVGISTPGLPTTPER